MLSGSSGFTGSSLFISYFHMNWRKMRTQKEREKGRQSKIIIANLEVQSQHAQHLSYIFVRFQMCNALVSWIKVYTKYLNASLYLLSSRSQQKTGRNKKHKPCAIIVCDMLVFCIYYLTVTRLRFMINHSTHLFKQKITYQNKVTSNIHNLQESWQFPYNT